MAIKNLKKGENKMKTKNVITATVACLTAICLVAPVWAQETGENRNLFENAGKKQVGADFKSRPTLAR